MNRYLVFAAFLSAFLGVFCFSTPVYASTSAATALSQCQAYATAENADAPGSNIECENVGFVSSIQTCLIEAIGTAGNYGGYVYSCTAPGSGCVAGTVVPDGTVIQHSSTSGASYYNGCTLSLVLGGPNSGEQVETGEVQPSGTSTVNQTATPSTQTSNSDGSQTFCNSSGQCMTYNPTTPINYDANGSNASTTSTSTMTNSATSSTSTTDSSSSTTGTISDGGGSGSGSGGSGGSYSSTTTGTSTTTTSSPASSSSSSQNCTTGVCDVGNFDGQLGTLYTPSQDTPQSVYSQFASSVSSSPLSTAVTGFFGVSTSGSCPSWSIPANKYWTSGFSFDFFCQSAILSLLSAAGYVVLAVAAYAAFKIALY